MIKVYFTKAGLSLKTISIYNVMELKFQSHPFDSKTLVPFKFLSHGSGEVQ